VSPHCCSAAQAPSVSVSLSLALPLSVPPESLSESVPVPEAVIVTPTESLADSRGAFSSPHAPSATIEAAASNHFRLPENQSIRIRTDFPIL
jgi:hypothetical protein